MSALQGEQVEGRRSVRELLEAGTRRVEEVWVSSPDNPIAALARQRGVLTSAVPIEHLDHYAESSNPQGVIAWAEPVRAVGLSDLGALSKKGLLVVLDHLVDPHNVGAILRSAVASGARGVILPHKRMAPLSGAVAKVASGALEYLSFCWVSGIPATLARLSKDGVWCIGLDSQGDASVFDSPLGPTGIAVVIGSEGEGLSRLTRERCDLVCSIPMATPGVESLNASAAAAVAFYALGRRHG